MKKKLLITFCILVFAVGIIGCVIVIKPAVGGMVSIRNNGETIRTIDLESAVDETFFVEYEGRKNAITVKDHLIFVSEADCPDKVCVNTGSLKYVGVPIVCVLNKLIIEFVQK